MSREQRRSVAIGVAVFLAGAALLGLEIAASRVLAPYFGNSLYVWGALIGVVLAGLSTGYWVGGAIADRYPTPRLLVAILGASSVLVLAIPYVDDQVLEWIVEWDPGPRLDPLLATICLFGVQSVLLGTVSPIAVRLKARSLEGLGRTAGRLFAISTAGSIAGTFATAFLRSSSPVSASAPSPPSRRSLGPPSPPRSSGIGRPSPDSSATRTAAAR